MCMSVFSTSISQTVSSRMETQLQEKLFVIGNYNIFHSTLKKIHHWLSGMWAYSVFMKYMYLVTLFTTWSNESGHYTKLCANYVLHSSTPPPYFAVPPCADLPLTSISDLWTRGEQMGNIDIWIGGEDCAMLGNPKRQY